MIKDGVKFYVFVSLVQKKPWRKIITKFTLWRKGPQVQEESTKQSMMIFKSGNFYVHGERTIRALIIGTEFVALWEAASFALWQNLLLSISNNVISRGSLGMEWKIHCFHTTRR